MNEVKLAAAPGSAPQLRIYDDRGTIYAGADYLHGVKIDTGHTLAGDGESRRVVCAMRKNGVRLVRVALNTS